MPKGVYTRTLEHNKKISCALAGRIVSDITKAKLRRREHSLEERAKVSASMKGKHPWNRGLTKDTDSRVVAMADAISRGLTGKRKSAAHASKVLKSLCARPNKFESKVHRLLESLYLDQFKYVGDGTVLINYKSPDFVSEDMRIAVLAHGVYFHLVLKNLENTLENKLAVAIEDSRPFVRAGYDCWVIWEDTLEIMKFDKECKQ